MSRPLKSRIALGSFAASLVVPATSASACAMCFGKSDSPLAQGMNWGIFSLLGVIVCVLSGIAGVGLFFAKKAAATPVILPSTESLPSTQKD